MSVVNIYNEDTLLTEFNVLDFVRDFIDSKMTADISYFSTSLLDQLFRELDRNNAQSEDYAYALSKMIVNIGNAARQPTSLEKCYKNHVRYKRVIITYFNKYKNKLSIVGKNKLRHSIEAQFKHFEINPIKMVFRGIAPGGVPLSNIILHINKSTLGGSIADSLVSMYTGWLAIKYYDLLDAVRMYKKAMYAEYDIEDAKSVYIRFALKNEAEYMYNIAYAVLDDMLKVYDQL